MAVTPASLSSEEVDWSGLISTGAVNNSDWSFLFKMELQEFVFEITAIQFRRKVSTTL